MEVNKDEAERCIQIAEKFIKEKQKEKAEKFLHKAERLYPTDRAKELLAQLNFLAPPSSSGIHTEQPHKRKKMSQQEQKQSMPEYSKDQLEAVKRINKCKDYYEILGVSKDATDSEIKKNYKKLALQFHPDKNKCPGSAEAFKAIGNAVAVLTDPVKRKQYDLYGPDEEHPTRTQQRGSAAYARGFEADATAEELFNMFFGRGFSGVYVRQGARWHRHSTHNRQEGHSGREHQQNTYSAFVQVLPIILAVVLSMASSFMYSDPAYSLQSNSKYTVLRRTHNLDIPYYVKENFATEYQGSVRRLEMSVEEEYTSNLRQACYREKNYRDSLLWKAKNFGDKDLYHTAQNMHLQACQKLHELRNHG